MGPPTAPRWGDDVDDSDEEPQFTPGTVTTIPPTHTSRIDSNGIQVVTSYKISSSNKQQLIKTITKVKVEAVKMKEAKDVEKRRNWKLFGQAALDLKSGNKTTVQSKDEVFLEDPHADKDLQDEDPAAAIAGNLNAFWAKQQRRQLERKYDVQADETPTETSGWTPVGKAGTTPAGSSGGKYVPPSARLGAASGSGVSGAYKPDRRDDLNTLRVTNLSENTTEADLQELFARFGRISRVYLAKDKETFQSRGFAFVSFVNKEDAAQAMEELQGFGTFYSLTLANGCAISLSSLSLGAGYDHLILKIEFARPNTPKDPATSGTEFRSGYGKALAQDTKAKVSYASNLTR